jgi:hypothetical protein
VTRREVPAGRPHHPTPIDPETGEEIGLHRFGQEIMKWGRNSSDAPRARIADPELTVHARPAQNSTNAKRAPA